MARPEDIPLEADASEHLQSTYARGAACLGLFASTMLVYGCAALPPQAAERALYIDARKALHGESRLGWTVDRVEIEDAANEAEPSACRVTPEDRAALRQWVSTQIAAQGGPARAQYEAGRDIDELEDALDLERTAALLERVELHMPEDCPFWEKPSHDFEGVHSTAHRVVWVAESMGSGSLLISGRHVLAGGGGSARVLASYGINERFQVAAGIEGGGDAVLARDADGTLSPRGAFRFGAPTWFRLLDIDRIYDLELALVSRFDEGSFNPLGARVAAAGGVNGLRRLGFMPALELWLGYEVYPAQHGNPAQHAIHLGTRVGFDWDP